MQQTKGMRKQNGATTTRRISLDSMPSDDVLDVQMIELMERIERVRSKAMAAVGTMLASSP